MVMGHGGEHMRRWTIPALALYLAAGIATAVAAPLEPLLGRWRGVEAELAPPGPVEPLDLDVEIERRGDGFRLSWPPIGAGGKDAIREPLNATFAPTGREGVYMFDQDEGSLIGRLFAAPATGNPLRGETLLWARVAADAMIIYSLAIERDGGFRLDRTELRVDDSRMRLVMTRRTGTGTVLTVTGTLRRAGA